MFKATNISDLVVFKFGILPIYACIYIHITYTYLYIYTYNIHLYIWRHILGMGGTQGGKHLLFMSHLYLIQHLNILSPALVLRLSHAVRREISTNNILLGFWSVSDFKFSDCLSNLHCYLHGVASVLEAVFCRLYPQGKSHCVLGVARPSMAPN